MTYDIFRRQMGGPICTEWSQNFCYDFERLRYASLGSYQRSSEFPNELIANLCYSCARVFSPILRRWRDVVDFS